MHGRVCWARAGVLTPAITEVLARVLELRTSKAAGLVTGKALLITPAVGASTQRGPGRDSVLTGEGAGLP